ncbi:MAG: hypothetical protein LBS30_04340, partial [Planctomycetota bacterium]|nr:hypothetical protein [Planctomycetota bacterium]
VLDNIDRLYGLRSLASRLDPEKLSASLGDIRDQSKERSPAFFRRVLAEAAALLESRGGGAPQSPHDAASLLAPMELARLEAPLTRFCRQIFLKGNSGGKDARSGKMPWIRGLFLAASAPGGGATPPVLTRLSAFAPAHEPFPVQPWFLRDLFRVAVPADAEEARLASGGASCRFAHRLFPAQAAAALAAALVLCLLVTWSFLENRGVLLSARGRAAAPGDADSLEQYRELASGVRRAADEWPLPRFGMTESEDLAAELQTRYADSYFDLKIVPGVEHIQDAALAAVENGDPAEIGNALLLLAVAREGIVRNLGAGDGKTNSLRALASSLRLISPEDARQMEAYFAWAGKRDWMPETAWKLAEFEKYIVDNAMDGDLGWLPEWVGTLPGLRAVDTSRVWSVPLADDSLSRVGPAWTREGYSIAKGLLEAVACDEANADAWRAKREEFLAVYRAQALERWRVAAAVLWSKFRRRVSDGEVHALLLQAARGDDPASRFGALLRHHLLPMFEDDSAGGDPDVAWLFLRERLELSRFDRKEGEGTAGQGQGGFANRLVGAVRELGSDESLDRWSRKFGLAEGGDAAEAMVSAERWREALRRFGVAAASPEENFSMIRAHFRSSRNGADVSAFDPLVQAGREASLLHGYLRETSGSGAWDGLSPLAVYDYMRYLATRQAALHLDALWREHVYDPAHLAPGDDGDRLERLAAGGGALEQFLTRTAAGFWHWDGDGLANAEWKRLSFMFDPDFLDFCRKALREKRPARPEQLELPFRVWAVDVDGDAVERPVRVEFVLASGGGEQVVAFSNFRIEETLVWKMDADAAVSMRVVFPSLTATIGFGEKGGLRNFVSAFSMGEARFEAGLFGDAEAALRRLGVNRVTVRAVVENGEQV